MSIISSLLTIKECTPEKANKVSCLSTYANDSYDEMINNGKCFVYVIVVFNRLLGRVVFFTDSENKELADGKSVCYFSNLWVHPKLRGMKIGSKLVRFVEKQAKKKGFKYLTLGVRKDNEKNVSIYKYLGFKEIVKDTNGKHINMKKKIQ